MIINVQSHIVFCYKEIYNKYLIKEWIFVFIANLYCGEGRLDHCAFHPHSKKSIEWAKGFKDISVVTA